MMIRRWCCWCTRRFTFALVGSGILGVTGFVAAFLLFTADVIGLPAFAVGVTAALVVYTVSLVVGHLGDPLALRRLGEDTPRKRSFVGSPVALRMQVPAVVGVRPRRLSTGTVDLTAWVRNDGFIN